SLAGRLDLLLASSSALAFQSPPRVLSLDPALDSEIDARTQTRLVVEFDRPMSTAGYSLCGGGPSFPKLAGQPRWESPTRLVADVQLAPDTEYSLGLNCASARNLRSAEGVALAPLQWSFASQPAEVRPESEQRARNGEALAKLTEALDAHYSYRDLRVKDWAAQRRTSEPAILAARTDRGCAQELARFLAPAADPHLWLVRNERVLPTFQRNVDPLFRRGFVDAAFRIEQVGPRAIAGRSADGIGYLLVDTWANGLDLASIHVALERLRDVKALAIDARTNSGGNEDLAREIAAWFVDGEVTYARHRVRTGPGADGFAPTVERRLRGNDAPRRIDVPLAVLTGPFAMSSNESFVLMLRRARDCTLVGQPTAGSSGNPQPFELGNGVVARIPSWQFLDAEGQLLEGRGVAPDVLVPCTPEDLKSGDPILSKALEVLRAKLDAR
ncbi:MAG: S41 family peptidase, partial [Planctomycetota bacterium]